LPTHLYLQGGAAEPLDLPLELGQLDDPGGVQSFEFAPSERMRARRRALGPGSVMFNYSSLGAPEHYGVVDEVGTTVLKDAREVQQPVELGIWLGGFFHCSAQSASGLGRTRGAGVASCLLKYSLASISAQPDDTGMTVDSPRRCKTHGGAPVRTRTD
jgi:hypothetical protein